MWRENGEEDTAGVKTMSPRRYELIDDAADSPSSPTWTDSACTDDRRIVNAFCATG